MLVFYHSCDYTKQSRYLTLWSDQYKAKLVFDFVAWLLLILYKFDYEKLFEGYIKIFDAKPS